MKKRGFTLIELLAVIVILAIITLIATPIVMNTIEKSKRGTIERSAENYIEAVDMMATDHKLEAGEMLEDGIYTVDNDGNLTKGSSTYIVEVNGYKPKSSSQLKIEDGRVATTSDEISLQYDTYTVTYNSTTDKLVATASSTSDSSSEPLLESICTPVSTQPYTNDSSEKGYAYDCTVSSTKAPYRFYVLGIESGKVNLIMDSNINNDGNPVKGNETNKGSVAWTDAADNSHGPTTALEYLNNATSSWDKLESFNLKYTDEGGRYGTITFEGKARLPYKSEIGDYNSTTGENTFLYENLDSHGGLPSSIPGKYAIYAYWSASTYPIAQYAWAVHYKGSVVGRTITVTYTVNAGSGGVRPVITLKL